MEGTLSILTTYGVIYVSLWYTFAKNRVVKAKPLQAFVQGLLGALGLYLIFFTLQSINSNEQVIWFFNSLVTPFASVTGSIYTLNKIYNRELNSSSKAPKAEQGVDFTFLLENLPVGIILSDMKGQISYCNRYIESLFKYSKQELLGKDVELLIPEPKRSSHFQYKSEYLKQPVEKSMGAGRVLNGMDKNGNLKDLEIGLRPIPGSFYGQESLVVAIKDVTYEQSVTRDLDEKNKLIQIATYSMPSLLGYLSIHGKYLFTNNAFSEYWKTSINMTGKHYSEILPSSFLEVYNTYFQETLKGNPTNFTHTFMEGSGQSKTFDIHLVPKVEDSSGTILGIIELFNDVTQQSEAERQLKISNQQLEDYAFLVSHDLRAPARHIANFIELLLEEVDLLPNPSENLKSHTKVISDNAKKMQSMISGLLKIASLSQIKPSYESLDIKSLLKSLFEDSGSELSLSIQCEHSPRVYSDKDLISHAFQNLFSNSQRYADKNSEVTIYVRKEGNGVVFDYYDEGPGISIDQKRFVFNAFHKGDNSTGLGIGLNIAKRALQQIGGSIDCLENDKGAHFKMRIPQSINPPHRNSR